jgi:hypothetical protein
MAMEAKAGFLASVEMPKPKEPSTQRTDGLNISGELDSLFIEQDEVKALLEAPK